MTNKGANTPESGTVTPDEQQFSKPPTVWEAIRRPAQLNAFRKNLIGVHRGDLKLALAQAVHELHHPSTESEKTVNFSFKQMIGRSGVKCEMNENESDSPSWVRQFLAILDQDPNVEHDNRSENMSKARQMGLQKIYVPQSIVDSVKDQIVKARTKIDEAGFLDKVIADLKNSDSGALMLRLQDKNNNTDNLAFISIEGKNGTLVMHDPKYKRDFNFSPNDYEGLRKFLGEHLKENHKDCVFASIVQLTNKNKLTSESTPTLSQTQKRSRALTTGRELDLEEKQNLAKRKSPDTPRMDNGDKDNKKKRKKDPSSHNSKGFK